MYYDKDKFDCFVMFFIYKKIRQKIRIRHEIKVRLRIHRKLKFLGKNWLMDLKTG